MTHTLMLSAARMPPSLNDFGKPRPNFCAATAADDLELPLFEQPITPSRFGIFDSPDQVPNQSFR
jgi:hypothetical protein